MLEELTVEASTRAMLTLSGSVRSQPMAAQSAPAHTSAATVRAGACIAALLLGMVLLPVVSPALAQSAPGNALTNANSTITGAAQPAGPNMSGSGAQQPGNPSRPYAPTGAPDNALPCDVLPDGTTEPECLAANARRNATGKNPDAFGRRPGPRGGKAQPAETGDTAAERGAARDERPVLYTEFQKYVFETTGQVLPQFGFELFRDNGQFRPVQAVPVPADYVLGPGDEVLVRMWGMIDAEFRLPIDRNGQVNIPKVGTFSLLGVKAADLEPALRAQIGKSFTHFHLSATLGQLRAMQVYVVGQALRPGVLLTSSLSTLVSAVFESGGPSPNGSLRRIELRREGKLLSTLDLYDFIVRGDKSADVRLLPGDVIVIPPAGPGVAVLGPIGSPAIFELKGGGAGGAETLQQALMWAGGATVLTSLKKARLERLDPADSKAPRSVEALSLDAAGLATPLRDGDVLTLFKLSPAYSNAVTLRGNVAAPLRYPYKPGMKLSDLIPDRDALVTPDYFVRKNVLVQFESARPLKEYDRAQDDATADTRNESGRAPKDSNRVQNDVHNIVDELNWDYAVIERLDRDTLATQLIPFDLGRLVLRKDPAADLPLMAGDVVTIFSVNDIRVPRVKRSIFVRVEGEVQRPGIYPMRAGDTLLTLLDTAGGLTPDAYLYGAEFTREETRLSQQEQMEKAIARLEAQAFAGFEQRIQSPGLDASDAAQIQARQQVELTVVRERLARLRQLKATGRINLGLTPQHDALAELPGIPLEDADRLYVPARPAFVQLFGSVNIESALLWQRGRVASDYLHQAGMGRFADKGAIFVIRADGSVSDGESSAFGGIGSLEIQPGDTIVVPELPDKATGYDRTMRTLKDIAVIFQGFGIGVAALKAVGL